MSKLNYKSAGVDIDAGERLVDLIKPMAKSTMRKGADTNIGGFGGIFDLKAAGFDDPVLVSGTDGVGTKLRIAIETGVLNSIGIDLVAMCVNDVLAQGAEPLFFLDYYACGKLQPEKAAMIISGIANGCRLAGCALIGGESAEMPGMYKGEDFDLAGFVVGAAERGAILPKLDNMQAGDVLIGLTSSGAHSNGYSLIRKIVEIAKLDWQSPAPFDQDKTLGEALLVSTKIYVKQLLPLIKTGKIKALAHITGGGLTDNIPRILPDRLAAHIDYDSWPRSELWRWLQNVGKVEEKEMRRAFNLGIGMVVCTAKNNTDHVLDALAACGENARVIGELCEK